jgi:phosphatidylinositol alpha-1,6-mannosyltransferase
VELDRHYREADIFLLTPEQVGLAFEGFGLVYLEAGAYGLPVVATRTGGVPDAVRHDETGLLASPGRADEVADCLLKLLEDPVRATRLGRANRDWSEHLTWERFARAQRDIYEQVLAGSPPGLERLA